MKYPLSAIVLFFALPSLAGHPDAGKPKGGLSYVPNQGQWAQAVLYRAESNGLAFFAENQAITWSKVEDSFGERLHDHLHGDRGEHVSVPLRGHAWRMVFNGAQPNASLVPGARKAHVLSYFLGNDPSKWAGNVPAYGNMTYAGLWPGIDLDWYSENGQYKYDLLLAPGAEVAAIGFTYEGLDGLELRGGDLVLRTSVGEVTELHPVARYADGAQEPIACGFTLKGTKVGFAFQERTDAARAIVIDPLLIASTLSGTGDLGITENYGHTATYDAAGNIYTGAICFGQGYPTTVGAFQEDYGQGYTDIAISKLNPDGSNLLWATYIGGDDAEYPHSLVTNAAGELTVYGSTTTTNYPTTAGAFDASANGSGDIVISKLNASGTALVGSTYVGGPDMDGINYLTTNYGDNYRGEVITDVVGNLYVASTTFSSVFPTSGGAYQAAPAGGQDGVLFCMNPDLSAMLWGTCMGTSGEDVCFGVKLDGAGGVYACGATNSPAFPVTPGAYQSALAGSEDAVVVHITNNGTTLSQSTYFGGGTGEDDAFFIELDTEGAVYIYGQTQGGIPIQPVGTYGVVNGDVFVAKLDATLSTAVFTSTIGTPGGFGSYLSPIAFLVDVCDHIYISGHGQLSGVSSGMPVTTDALQTDGGFYLAAFDVDMTGLLFGSYYGDIGDHVDGGTSRFDANGIVYQGVCTGGNFPTTAWAWSNTQPFGWDIAVFKLDFQAAGVNAAGGSSVNSGCAPIQIDFLNNSTGTEWIWDFGDGSAPESAYTPSHLYTTPGTFTVTLIAMDSLACNLADTMSFPVDIGTAAPLTAAFTAEPNADCTVSEVILTNTSTGAPLGFEWDLGDGSQSTDTNVVHTYSGPGTYDIELLVYDPTGCSQPDSLTQTITLPEPLQVQAAFTVEQQPDCSLLLVTGENASTGPSPTYLWDMGDGAQYATVDVSHTYTAPGQYTVQLIATDPDACNLADTATTEVQVDPIDPLSAGFTIEVLAGCDGLEVNTTNTSIGDLLLFSWAFGDGTSSNDTNTVHTYATPGTYTLVLTVTDALGCSPPDTATAQFTVDPLVPVAAAFSLGQTGNCAALTVTGVDQSTGDSLSYSWDMGDGTVLNTPDVDHVYTDPGTYTVTLTITDAACGQVDEVTQLVTMIADLPNALVSDAAICFGESTVLDGTADVDGYLWSTGATTPTITVSEGGQYVVQVFTDNCQGADTVDVVEVPEYDLGFDVIACPESPVELVVPMSGLSYTWNTGGTGQVEQVTGPGEYIFTVIDNLGCPHTDTVRVAAFEAHAQLYAPNAFTPDGDGVNDEFIITGAGEDEVELIIFDRWGERLYATTSMTEPWDGTYSGEPVKQDVYVYRLEYNAYCDQAERTTVYGHVSVLR